MATPSGTTKCPRCGAEVDVGATQCGECGRMMKSSKPVKLKQRYWQILAFWCAVLAFVGVCFWWMLDETTQSKAVIKTWIDATRWPFNNLMDVVGQPALKQKWHVGSVVTWAVIGGIVGAVVDVLKRAGGK